MTSSSNERVKGRECEQILQNVWHGHRNMSQGKRQAAEEGTHYHAITSSLPNKQNQTEGGFFNLKNVYNFYTTHYTCI